MTPKLMITTVLSGTMLCSVASSDELCMTLDSFDAHESYALAINGNLQWYSDASVTYTSPIKAGERKWTTEYGQDIVTYCIQLYEGIDIGQSLCFDVVHDLTTIPEWPPYPGPMNSTQVGLVEDLYARYIDKETGQLRSGTSLTDSYDYNTAASAFQLVLWEISHEAIQEGTLNNGRTELTLDLGAFRADTSSHVTGGNAADLIMSSLGDGGWKTMGGNLIGLTNETYQDQLMVVPLPMPALLAGIGLAGAVVMRRRFR